MNMYLNEWWWRHTIYTKTNWNLSPGFSSHINKHLASITLHMKRNYHFPTLEWEGDLGKSTKSKLSIHTGSTAGQLLHDEGVGVGGCKIKFQELGSYQSCSLFKNIQASGSHFSQPLKHVCFTFYYITVDRFPWESFNP